MKKYLKIVSLSLFFSLNINLSTMAAAADSLRTPPAGQRRLVLNNQTEITLDLIEELKVAVKERNQAPAGSPLHQEKEKLCYRIAWVGKIDALTLKEKHLIDQILLSRG